MMRAAARISIGTRRFSEGEIVARQTCEGELLIFAFWISEEVMPPADETSLAIASGRGEYFGPNAGSVWRRTLPLVAVCAAVAHTRSIHAGLCGEPQDRLGRL